MNHIAKIYATIAETTDDGREQDAATWNGIGNAGNVITFGNVSGSIYSGAFRFRHIDIPRNSKIVLARLKIRPAFTENTGQSVAPPRRRACGKNRLDIFSSLLSPCGICCSGRNIRSVVGNKKNKLTSVDYILLI